MVFKNFGFAMFNIKNECISTLVSSYSVAASFITSSFFEDNTENEEFEKRRVLQKCPLMHIILIIIIITIIIIVFYKKYSTFKTWNKTQTCIFRKILLNRKNLLNMKKFTCWSSFMYQNINSGFRICSWHGNYLTIRYFSCWNVFLW